MPAVPLKLPRTLTLQAHPLLSRLSGGEHQKVRGRASETPASWLAQRLRRPPPSVAMPPGNERGRSAFARLNSGASRAAAYPGEPEPPSFSAFSVGARLDILPSQTRSQRQNVEARHARPAGFGILSQERPRFGLCCFSGENHTICERGSSWLNRRSDGSGISGSRTCR